MCNSCEQSGLRSSSCRGTGTSVTVPVHCSGQGTCEVETQQLPVVEELVPVSLYWCTVLARGHARQRHSSFRLSRNWYSCHGTGMLFWLGDMRGRDTAASGCRETGTGVMVLVCCSGQGTCEVETQQLPVVEKLVLVSWYRYAVPARGHARQRHSSFRLSRNWYWCRGTGMLFRLGDM